MYVWSLSRARVASTWVPTGQVVHRTRAHTQDLYNGSGRYIRKLSGNNKHNSHMHKHTDIAHNVSHVVGLMMYWIACLLSCLHARILSLGRPRQTVTLARWSQRVSVFLLASRSQVHRFLLMRYKVFKRCDLGRVEQRLEAAQA